MLGIVLGVGDVLVNKEEYRNVCFRRLCVFERGIIGWFVLFGIIVCFICL